MKDKIIETGLQLWRDDPAKVTANGIARILGVSHVAVLYHFQTAENMRRAIAAEAVRIGDSRVITHLIASRHLAVVDMPASERAQHFKNCAQ